MEYADFLSDLIIEYLPKYFSEAEMQEIADLDIPLTGPNGLRFQLGELDPEFFGKAYFPHYFSDPAPHFHREMYDMMVDIITTGGKSNIVEAAPRGHSKSTLWSFLLPMWCGVYGLKRVMAIFCDTSSQAEGFLANIKSEFENNDHLLEDFGRLQGKTWKVDEIILKTDVKISAKGSGTAVRGIRYKHMRPDLLIFDDIQDRKAMNSPDQRKELREWYDRDVIPLGDPKKCDVVTVGNIIHYADLMTELLERPGVEARKYQAIIEWSKSTLWDDWTKIYTDKSRGTKQRKADARAFFEEHEEEMMAGVETIWPERWSYYAYMLLITDQGLSPFLSEYQNDPIDPAQQWISPNDFQYYGGKDEPVLPPPSELTFKGSVDPSMGKGKKSDFSAICTVARDNAGFLYVVDSNAERRHPDKITNDILDLSEMYHYEEFAVETIAFQELFSHDLKKAGMAKGIYLNVIEVKPRTDKEIRIMKLQSFIKNGYLKFHRSQKELIDQLVYLGKWANDDQADALEMAVSLFIEQETDFVHSMMPDICGVSVNW